jgi:hypothetical protein
VTFTPAVNKFFNMQAPDAPTLPLPLTGGSPPGIQWARVWVSAVITYVIVEIEKALIDPVVVPLMRPIIRFIRRISPKWLDADFTHPARVAGRLCKAPRTKSMAPQRKGTLVRSKVSLSPELQAAAAAATGSNGATAQV